MYTYNTTKGKKRNYWRSAMQQYPLAPNLIGLWIRWAVQPFPFHVHEIRAIDLYHLYVEHFRLFFALDATGGPERISVRRFYQWVRGIYPEINPSKGERSKKGFLDVCSLRRRDGWVVTAAILSPGPGINFLRALAKLIKDLEKNNIQVDKPLYVIGALKIFDDDELEEDDLPAHWRLVVHELLESFGVQSTVLIK
jgi:hypothetical protein